MYKYRNDEEMENAVNIDILKLVKEQRGSISFGDDVVLMEFNESNCNIINRKRFGRNTKVQFDTLSVLFVLDGEINIKINGTDFYLKSKAVLDILEMHIVQNFKVSPDFRGFSLTISKNFMGETMHGIKMIPISTFLSRIKNPIENINDEEAVLLREIILRIVKNISRNDHYAQRDIIKNEIRSLFIELLNIISQKDRVKTDHILNNKEEIIGKFLQLVGMHCKEQHSVEFYANELCIDAKYLSRILKSLNGNTASTWIDDSIMKEAKFFLQDKTMTIQQISDVLNFSDQSAFGKFFKKHSGMSPMSYKKDFM